jgi:hypothetical protein
MARREPRRSDLAGLSPTAPARDTARTDATSAAIRANPGRREASKLTVYVATDLAGQARAAWWATSHLTGCRSFSDWVTEAIADKLARDSAAYNGGEPYVPVAAGNIPTGRRI